MHRATQECQRASRIEKGVLAHDTGLSPRRSSGAVRSPPTSPVFGVPNGSMSRSWHTSEALGQCSTPLGTTSRSPGAISTAPSRICIVKRPAYHEKEFIGVVVLVPDPLALDLDEL